MRSDHNTLRTRFIIAIIILFSISLFLFLNIQELVQTNKRVNYTWEVQDKVQDLYAGLKIAESDVRAYLITKDKSFLRSRLAYRLALPGKMKNLKGLTNNNSVQRKNLYQLEDLVLTRLSILDSTIEYARFTDRFLVDTSLVYRGARTMNMASNLVDHIIAIERNQLTEQQLVQSRYGATLPLYAFLLNLLLLSIVGFMFYRLEKQVKELQTFHDQLQLSHSELEQRQLELQARNEELESFNFIASHDLKEPLRKINLFTSMIYEEDYPALSEPGKFHFGRIQSAVKRMQALLEDLLAYTRIKTTGEAMLEQVDLNTIVEEVKENLKEQITELNAKIETKNLPVLRGIPFQLNQLIDNLLSNAIKYNKPGIPPYVCICSQLIEQQNLPAHFRATHPRYHCIQVKDNGIGFEQQYAETIFELFSRLHNDTEQPGTGVGLTICKKIVENHDGFISVESNYGVGTTFFIYLPE